MSKKMDQEKLQALAEELDTELNLNNSYCYTGKNK